MTERKERNSHTPDRVAHTWNERLNAQVALAVAIVITDLGWTLGILESSPTSLEAALIVAHALAIGGVVYLWLRFSVRLAAAARLPLAVAEGVMLLVLGLAVAGVEFFLLRSPARVAHTVTAVVGMLSGWMMRSPPPQRRGARRRQ